MKQYVHFTVLGMSFLFFSFLVLFIFTGSLQQTKFFATIPRVEMASRDETKRVEFFRFARDEVSRSFADLVGSSL